jgi:hypothetical protein
MILTIKNSHIICKKTPDTRINLLFRVTLPKIMSKLLTKREIDHPYVIK